MTDLKNLSRDIKALAERLQRANHTVATAAVELFTDNLANGTDMDGRPLKARDPEFSGQAGRGVLTRRGHLRRSIRVARVGSSSITIESTAPQAELLNEGGTVDITPNMRRFFWAKHYEKMGRGVSGAEPRLNKTNRAIGRDAAIWRALALKRTPLRFPERRFMGGGPRLDRAISTALDNLPAQ